MGLNPRGRGRGGKGRRGAGMNGPGPAFRGPPGMFGPPMGFPPGPRPFGPPFFGGPCFSNFGPRRPPGFGKFPRKNFKARNQQRSNDSQNLSIDLTKPWVTEEIKNEEAKKQEYLEVWRKSKDDNDWNKYKEQKQTVQTLYDKAKAEYMENKPEEAMLFSDSTTEQKESQSYYCEVCDRAFKSEKDLYLHELEHETCGRDGCQFSAHPKLVAKHIRTQHDTGLYNRIGKLDTEEAVAKWLEERKRKYPTKKVIEEKKILEEEKIKRGERINEDKSRFNKTFMKTKGKRRRSSDGDGPKKDCKGRFGKRRKLERQEKTVLEALKEEERLRSSIPPFDGIRELYDIKPPVPETEKVFTDEEWDATVESESTPKFPENVSSSLSVLASFYDSEEDLCKSAETSVVSRENVVSGDEGAPEEAKTVHVKEGETIVVNNNNDNDNKNNNNNKKKRTRRGKRGRKTYSGKENKSSPQKAEPFSTITRKLTLLEKLLSDEIRHERNVILQCVRYVVINNFFRDS